MADSELTNYRSGIDVVWGVGDGSDKGTAYQEEYLYHDKLVNDAKIVYIKSDTNIRMSHNSRNKAFYNVADGGNQVIGVNGLDGVPDSGDEGIIRYKIDRDRQDYLVWSDNTARTITARVAPAYTAPFTLASQQYGYGDAVNVVGTTGSNGGTITSKTAYYYRGILDSVGDEWHTLSYADDDNEFLRIAPNYVDLKFWASDAKSVLLVVNPKTPCFTARVTGTGQFYTTPPKAYWTPKIVDQTTYIDPGASGTVTIEIRDINGNNVFYRINGGSFTDAGAATVTLDDADFSDGSNTLEYYYAGNAAYTKTRTVVKNPTHPSLAEDHGNYLWFDSSGYSDVLSRITRAPYKSTYDSYKTGTGAKHSEWDAVAGQGYRGIDRNTAASLPNAFVALVNGFSYTKSGDSKSFGQYAKEMLLENCRTQDSIGFEVQMSAGASGNREMHAFGYYDAIPVLRHIFAYDIMVANFRSNQVTGGITPVEDYFIRDCWANFAYEAMQWSAGMTGLGSPEMWGGARMMCAVSIAIVMPEYTSPVFGTSGFGTVQTTYPLCPYENDEFTWKEALFDGQTLGAYPDFAWNTGLSDNGTGSSLFFAEGETYGGHSYSLGTWKPKAAYFSFALMGTHLFTWANMVKMWAGGHTDPRLEIAIQNAVDAQFIGATDTYPQTPSRHSVLTVLNSRWPNAASANTAWVQSLSSTDSNSDDKTMSDAGVFGFAWYDDTYYGTPSDPVDTTAPTPNPSTLASVAVLGDGLRLTATTATDASGTVIYEFSCVTEGSATYWLPSQSSNVLDIAGLLPSTVYDCRVRAKDAYGNTTTQSGITQQTTAAADNRPRRSPRGRGMTY